MILRHKDIKYYIIRKGKKAQTVYYFISFNGETFRNGSLQAFFSHVRYIR